MIEVPARLTPSSSWLYESSNMTNLRLFLDTYQININDVYEIQFAKRWMKVSRYERDERGSKFMLDGGDIAKLKPKTVQYRGGLTPIVSDTD